MEQKTFAYEAAGQTLVIHLPRDIDHHNCKKLKIETDLLLEENYIRRIVFDFSHTQFMDSSGIGLILGRHKLISAMGGVVVVQKAPKDIKRMLSIAGIESKD